jgi:hypothetical protein
MIAVGVAIEIGLYVLADNGGISNWWFVVGTILLVFLWPAISRMVMPAAFKTEAAEARSALDVPLELVGVDLPMTPEILAELDDHLGIPAPTSNGATTTQPAAKVTAVSKAGD